jgi:hypothetical protein
MDQFPLAVLQPEDHGDPQRAVGYPPRLGEVGPEPFQLKDVGDIGPGFSSDLLERATDATGEPARGEIQALFDLGPASPEPPGRVGEGDVISPRPECLLRFRITPEEGSYSVLRALDRDTEVWVGSVRHDILLKVPGAERCAGPDREAGRVATTTNKRVRRMLAKVGIESGLDTACGQLGRR